MFFVKMVFGALSLGSGSDGYDPHTEVIQTLFSPFEQLLGADLFAQKKEELCLLAKEKVVDLASADLDITNDLLMGRIRREILASLYCKAVFVFNAIPQTIQDLQESELLRVFYAKALYQTNGWTCGYWGLFNAAALHSIIKEGGELSTETLCRKARTYFDLYPKIDGCIEYICSHNQLITPPVHGENTATEHLQLLVEMQNPEKETVFGDLKDFLMFTGLNEDGGVYIDPAGGATCHALGNVSLENVPLDPEPLQDALKDYVRNQFKRLYIDTNERGALYFICYIKAPVDHWVLIAPVKIPDYPPLLMVLDSYNFALNDKSDTSKLVSFFYKECIKPYC